MRIMLGSPLGPLPLLLLSGACLFLPSALAINKVRIPLLTKEECAKSDADATDLYNSKYDKLDFQNVTYDEHLYRSLKAYRQSVVVQHLEYIYSDKKVMRDSQGPKVDRELCKQQVAALANMARVLKGSPENYGLAGKSIPISAINLLETYGQSGSGLLNGNRFWFGSYSGCVRAKIPAESSRAYWPAGGGGQPSEIVGRYCVAHLRAKAWPEWDFYFEDRISIKVGVCLPESCHSQAYVDEESVRANVDYLARFRLTEPFSGDRYTIGQLYCLPDEDSSYRQLGPGAKVFIACCLVWFAFLVHCNVKYGQRVRKLRRLQHEKDTNNPHGQASANGTRHNGPVKEASGFDYVKAFSIVANLEHLCKTDLSGIRAERTTNSESLAKANGADARQPSIPLVVKMNPTDGHNSNQDKPETTTNLQAPAREMLGGPEKRVNLDLLDGIKVICTFYVIYVHVLMLSSVLNSEMRFFDEWTTSYIAVIFYQGFQMVSVFYIMAGILLTYLSFTRMKPKQLLSPAYWALVIVGRYLRLVPLFFLVYIYAKVVATHTGSGALWPDYRTDAQQSRSHCDTESWWRMITLTANDRGIDQCVPHGWYLTIDFRNMFMLPFYIALLAVNRFAAYGAIVVTILLAIWRYIYILMTAKADVYTLVHFKPHSFAIIEERATEPYQSQLVRLGTCLLGVLTGHLLYLYETRQIKEWPAWLRKWGLKIVCGFLMMVFLLPPTILQHFRQYLPEIESLPPAFYYAVFPVGELLTQAHICLAILLMATGGGSKVVKSLLTSHGAKVLVGVTYAIYLLHIEMMVWFPGFMLVNANLNWYLVMSGAFFGVAAMVAAFFVHVLYEMPINNITRHYLKQMMSRTIKK